jgi:hypothetical protein
MSRWRVTFWLDDQKELDWSVGQSIKSLKLERKFVSAVRDGIRLIVDLRAGRLDVLFELFPWTRDALPGSTLPPSGDGELRREIQEMKRLILEGSISAPPDGYPVMKQATGPKALNVPKLAAPVFDDDDQDTVVLKRSTNTDSGQTFLNAMMGLQG